ERPRMGGMNIVPAVSSRILALAAAVLMVHLLILRVTPGPVQMPSGARPFVTRSLLKVSSAVPLAETGAEATPVVGLAQEAKRQRPAVTPIPRANRAAPFKSGPMESPIRAA